LFDTETNDLTTNLGVRPYDVSPDGSRFLFVKNGRSQSTARAQVVVVQNWIEELKRLVPTN
jgi:hypothetical protein